MMVAIRIKFVCQTRQRGGGSERNAERLCLTLVTRNRPSTRRRLRLLASNCSKSDRKDGTSRIAAMRIWRFVVERTAEKTPDRSFPLHAKASSAHLVIKNLIVIDVGSLERIAFRVPRSVLIAVVGQLYGRTVKRFFCRAGRTRT